MAENAAPVCRHCYEPIEQANGYDYVTRGPYWRHSKTKEVHCRVTVAAPETCGAVLEAARIERETGVNPLAVGCAGDD